MNNIREKILNKLYFYLNENNACFIDFIKQFVGEIKNVSLKAGIGKKEDNYFLSFLNSYVDNFIVKFNDTNNEPMIYFYDYYKSKNIMCINLNKIENINIEKREGVYCNFVKIEFTYINMNYYLEFKFKNVLYK